MLLFGDQALYKAFLSIQQPELFAENSEIA